MKNKSSISLGPGAPSLILIFVALSLAALGMLSLMTGRNDLRLAERSVQVTEAVYALQVRAEECRAEIEEILTDSADSPEGEEDLSTLEAALPDTVEQDGSLLFFTVEDGARMLDCTLEVLPSGAKPRTAWVRYNLSAETEDDSWNW
ncbi:MAG: hypothetical protein IJG40_11065 [Oscillospiraceae bacterium]|nr:hypothetical protein [Oscillospiraceae bacterium]